ncbi:Rrf2 family transcriptional regulator [Mediterraneibacter sp. NSJ-151]|uniref:Rrf2 family transcriptional regulator n=1 Tax=Mediterraneibacter sp. NSJ-151 TaxID=2897708 RepID=UPI001F0B56DA|nr:Rrf2 family transcriptional regulator [Mediterraneibacter sp. NSJ-151]MCH4279523.1 Rrf2 family transcriptional regulator [Mediterraneibacter sp. NSJ-151]
MQLTSTTDYAIRIVCYLAAQRQMISTSELSQELSVPSSYIPKITKKLKQAGIIKACEGIKGGYQIAKQPENISLKDVISCTESTMAISRCLEKEGGCSQNYITCCKVHQILLDLQNIYNNRLESVKISDIIRPGKDEYLGKFYVIIKVNLREKDYECIYSHNHDVYEQVKTAESYDDFIKKYAEKYICEADWVNVQKCLAGENLTEHLVDGCVEEEIFYRGIIENNGTSYVWMKASKYVDVKENTAIITFHNTKVIPNTIVTMEQELRKKEQDVCMELENATINLQDGFLSEFAQDEEKKTYQRDIIQNILNGLLSSKEMTEAAAQLGMKESDTYRVVDFHTITKNVQRKYTKEQLHEVGVIEGELMHLLPDALIYRNMDQIVMIQQVDSDQTELEYQKEMEEIEEVIQQSILYRKKDTDFQIGIGKSVGGYQRLKESYHEASQAIKYIEIIRQVTGDKNKSVVNYSNLGFFQIFGKVDDMMELERCIPETLKKLYLYDDEHKGELITTLQMYLRNNQSIKKTAGAMFVHYRTISYRLEKIKQISGINFDNANEVLAVSNGLIIYKMLKEIE